MLDQLEKLYQDELLNCRIDCPLRGTTTIVKGHYPEQPVNIAFVGEAPGARETELGQPFVGMAGSNFEDFLKSLDLTRNDVFITNTVKCRPTVGFQGRKNRAPYSSELEACSYYLKREMEITDPKLIITLGNVPLRQLLKDKKASITHWHGTLFFYGRAKVFPIHHPGAITYNRKLKGVIAEDLKVLKKLITLQK
jgi:DNA polymerase